MLELKEDINTYEEKNLSLKSQLKAKNDTIKRLESKLKAFRESKSIGVRLEVSDTPNLLER